jgi:ubiquinone/menaquinone biosynthesis C-methylase UbiE
MKLSETITHYYMKTLYWFVSNTDKKGEITLLNYGYVNVHKIKLAEKDEINRYSLQLYHLVASSINLKNQDVLEVGCGRGGGAAYIASHLRPKSLKGVDLTKKAIKFCNQRHRIEGLSFVCADALSLPFEGSSFDTVINIESSHRYTNMDQFLKKVYRVLKPGGHFLFADFRFKTKMDLLQKQLANSGLSVVKKKDITTNIIKALDLDNKRKLALIKKTIPVFLHSLAKGFAGVKGSEVYDSFVSGKRQYFHYVLQKPNEVLMEK